MKSKFLLIGCGNLGKRHLESLVDINISKKIDIIEPDEFSRKEANKVLKNKINTKITDIKWHTDFKKLNYSHDVTIIATQANNRMEIIEKTLEKGNKKLIIEKMVCQSNKEYKKILLMIEKHHSKAWVNTSRRYFKSYQEIYKKIPKGQLSMNITSGDNGLGTNAIHFVDLFRWFTTCKKIKLNGNYIENELLKNKRGVDLVEFRGTIFGNSENNSILSIIFSKFKSQPTIINITTSKNHFIINESDKTIYEFEKNKIKNYEFEFEPTSELSKKIVIDLLKNKKCKLPSLEESYLNHSELFRIFNSKIKRITGKNNKLCPIT